MKPPIHAASTKTFRAGARTRLFPGPAIALLLALATTLHAQVPNLINYQGRVAVGTPAVNFNSPPNGQFKFALVSAGGVPFWTNSPDLAPADGVPDNAVSLTVTKGLYSVLLGDATLANMALIPAAVFTNPDLRLRVWFNDGTTGFQLLTPDQRLAPTAYLSSGAVTPESIADGAITTAKIAPYAIRTEHFFPGSLDYSILQTANSAGPGQVLGFNGGSLVWTAPGGVGSIWTLNSTNDAYYNGGKVGIGTPIPSSKLEIMGAQDALGIIGYQPVLTMTDSGAAGNPRGRIQSAGGGISLETESLITNANPSAILTLANSGNVGIGTGTPSTRLEIASPSPVITMTDSSSAGNPRTAINSAGGDLYLISAGFLNNSNTTGFVRLSSDGKVGIGTYTAQSTLDIVGQQDALRMTGSQPFLTLYDSSSGFAASRIQGVGGAIIFEPQSHVSGSNSNHYARLSDDGTFSVRVLTIRGGADLAEPFQMKEEELEKGVVVVIDEEHPGRLKRSTGAYDTRVAGIISGANGVDPGISLHQEGVIEGGQNVALSGRVYVQADASGGPIKAGDLLTTSDVPGHAMKVTDHTRAQGAVLGKAMSALDEGTGMVLVLVTLQ